MKKSKGKKCPQCQGQGIAIDHMKGELATDEKSIIVSNIAYTFCPRCKGIGILGISELEHLSLKQRANLVKGKTYEELFSLLNDKSHEELVTILQNIPSQTD